MKLGGLAAVALVLGCRGRAEPRPDASTPSSPSECQPEIKEKLGVPFLRVCPSGAMRAESSPPIWLSMTPIPCAKGEHDNVRCPDTIALTQPREGVDPAALHPSTTLLAAVIEVDIAHKICSMRFGGRLPTHRERALAREAVGATSITVAGDVYRADSPGYRVTELSEWVTEVPCEQPTSLGPECKPHAFPTDASAAIAWNTLVSCEARPLNPTEPVPFLFEVGSDCPGGRERGDASAELRCALHGPVADARSRTTVAYALRCSESRPTPPRLAPDSTDVAAFRCALPQWL